MKKSILPLVLVVFLVIPSVAYSVPDDTIVYITPTGEKYHRESCSYTNPETVRELTIRFAEIRGYEPCSRCDPDILTEEYVSSWDGNSGSTSVSKPAEEVEVKRSLFESVIVALIIGGFFVLFILPVIASVIIVVLLILFSIYQASPIAKRRAAAIFESRRKQYLELYGSKTELEIARSCGMPPGVFIGPDGFPFSNTHDFIFYVSKTGESFHRKMTCTKGAYIPCHAVFLGPRIPCKRCRPVAPDVTWFEEYQKAMKIVREYNIPLADDRPPRVCLKTGKD